jgi:hypothetical protein
MVNETLRFDLSLAFTPNIVRKKDGIVQKWAAIEGKGLKVGFGPDANEMAVNPYTYRVSRLSSVGRASHS